MADYIDTSSAKTVYADPINHPVKIGSAGEVMYLVNSHGLEKLAEKGVLTKEQRERATKQLGDATSTVENNGYAHDSTLIIITTGKDGKAARAFKAKVDNGYNAGELPEAGGIFDGDKPVNIPPSLTINSVLDMKNAKAGKIALGNISSFEMRDARADGNLIFPQEAARMNIIVTSIAQHKDSGFVPAIPEGYKPPVSNAPSSNIQKQTTR